MTLNEKKCDISCEKLNFRTILLHLIEFIGEIAPSGVSFMVYKFFF